MIWVKFALIVLIVYVLNAIVKFIFRKAFKIEKDKKPVFSINYFNEWHRKMDSALRITSLIVFIVTTILIFIEGYSINILLITAFFFFGLDFAIKAFFERKFSKNPKQYILTVSEGIIILLITFIVFKFGLLV